MPPTSPAPTDDVTGTQSATTVSRLQGRNLSCDVPQNGNVIKFNAGANKWGLEPGQQLRA